MASAINNLFYLPEGSEESTFAYDDTLPNLPLPTLEATLSKYLESVMPFVTPEEYKKTKEIVDQFKINEGKMLQDRLEARAKNERNWAERMWEENAYLRNRTPLVPGCSMLHICSFEDWKWTCNGPDDQIKNAALLANAVILYWKMIKEERLRPNITADGKTKLSMHLMRRLFNTARVPGLEVDSVSSYFKTDREGTSPSHLILMNKGRFFKLNVLYDGELLTGPELGTAFRKIINTCKNEPAAYPVGVLTADERTSWAKNHEMLKSLSAKNAAILEDIESSITVISFDDNTPEELENIAIGNASNRWFDKTLNDVFTDRGYNGGITEHACVDGLVTLVLSHYVHAFCDENGGGWSGRMEVHFERTESEELCFDLNDHLKSEIQRVLKQQHENSEIYRYSQLTFNDFGKDKIKKLRLHPDSLVQMSLQLAYMRLHGKPASCYETATTRAFYHGRTETVRAGTSECIEWAKAMLDENTTRAEKQSLLIKAVMKHDKLMFEGRSGSGCDRHLMGLYCAALEENLPIPDLFKDPSYSKSGGGGNFILSTSLIGYYPLFGCAMPMIIDGYGVFYSIMPDCINITIAVNKKSAETDRMKYFDSLTQSLRDMKALMPDA